MTDKRESSLGLGARHLVNPSRLWIRPVKSVIFKSPPGRVVYGMSEEEEEDLGIKPGTVIESSKAKYSIIKLLGEGGFGAVYKVQDQANKDKHYAMKVEKKIETRKDSKLKMEIAILKLVNGQRKQSHFTDIADRGKKDTFFFLVMELVGKSLADLKSLQKDKVFSIGTALGASQQCLEACEDLHRHGFIHRDLKPANYACGLGGKKRVVYMLDFGIARKVVNDKKELKTPRAQAKFKGTVRFASMACHKSMELGYKDDCESWFYLLLDLTVKEGLPWKKVTEKNDVLRVKEEVRKDKRELLWGGIKCKEELSKLLDYIDSLKYHDKVDYQFAYKMLTEACKTSGVSIDDPYDWEKE